MDNNRELFEKTLSDNLDLYLAEVLINSETNASVFLDQIGFFSDLGKKVQITHKLYTLITTYFEIYGRKHYDDQTKELIKSRCIRTISENVFANNNGYSDGDGYNGNGMGYKIEMGSKL